MEPHVINADRGQDVLMRFLLVFFLLARLRPADLMFIPATLFTGLLVAHVASLCGVAKFAD